MPKEQLVSPVTGTLGRILFNNEDNVFAGDTVAEVECMKMIFPLLASVNGIVTYYASEGELVATDQIVAEINIL